MKIPISNKILDESLIESMVKNSGEELIFTIAGDLDLSSKYENTILSASKTKLYTFSESGEVISTWDISSLSEINVKRMYGNLVLRAKTDKKSFNIFRCTYRSASHIEAAAQYLSDISSGGDGVNSLGALEDSFEKEMSVCPKCGRTLPSPGAECLACGGKGKVIKKLWKYIQPQLPSLTLSLFLSIVATVLSIVPPYMTKMLVDDIIPSGNLKLLYIVVAAFFGSYLIQFVIFSIRNYILRISGNKIIVDLRTDVYNHAQYLSMKFFDKTSTGAVITRINSDTSTLQSFILNVIPQIIVQACLVVGIMSIMLIMDWKLTLLSIFPVPIVIFSSLKFQKYIRPFYRRIWRRNSAVSSVLTDTIPCVKVIKSFTGEKRASDKFKRYMDEWFNTDKKYAPVLSTYSAAISFVVNSGLLIIWLVGGATVIKDPAVLTAGTLVSFINYTGMFYGPVSFLATVNDSFQGMTAATERIMDILDAEQEINFGEGVIPEKLDGKIEFENVSFAFDRSKKVLSNINVTIEKGDIVGIVGTTGSGKSTLINLLMRFYDNYEGRILVDGKDIRDIDLSYWRGSIGYVQQDPMMFNDTIYNNIAYGSPSATPEEIIAAADIANAHEFIARCPDGYDSVLGERGVGLSGGERQRLSIARAVLKNPSILVFDEATAAVDSETEHLIQEAIDRLISGRTTLMIAHRLSTLAKANKIIVVDGGEIIECGTPEELLAMKGKYYRLVQIQSAGSSEILSKDLLN